MENLTNEEMAFILGGNGTATTATAAGSNTGTAFNSGITPPFGNDELEE